MATRTSTPAIPARYADEFTAAGHAYGIPPQVLAGVAWVESAFGANRGPSSAGARGLMQFMPGTAAGLGVDVTSDRSSIWGAAKYLRQLGYGTDAAHALSSYNAGPAATGAARAQGNAYARTVLSWADRFAPDLPSAPAAGKTASSSPPSSSPTTTTTAAAGGKTFGQLVLQLFLTGVLVAAGAVLAGYGLRTVFSSSPATSTRATT